MSAFKSRLFELKYDLLLPYRLIPVPTTDINLKKLIFKLKKMKKLFAFALCLTLGLTVSFAQADGAYKQAQKGLAKEAVKEEVVPGPMMNFESTEVDYGTIEQHSDPYRYFKFTNSGDEPLVIKHAKGSCGCTVPTYPKEPILPGETAEIKVRYATDRVGPFTKTITLTTNEASETKVLRIKGKVNKAPAEPDAIPAAAPSILGGQQGTGHEGHNHKGHKH